MRKGRKKFTLKSPEPKNIGTNQRSERREA